MSSEMIIPKITVDLRLPPAERWAALSPYVAQARELRDFYLTDLGGMEPFREVLAMYRDSFIDPIYLAEINALAAMVGVAPEEALVTNLYYDAMKLIFGCTAFAVDTPSGPLHARNLDWWTENRMLARYTIVTDFQAENSAGAFQSVSWPGFIGVLSGLAPGRFAITLNAALSNELPGLAPPITFVLRSVFEQATTFSQAVDMLTTTAILSDCLLLVTGTQPGEMVVIERTPTRAEVRYPQAGFIVVANDYRQLASLNSLQPEQQLQATSCGRFDRATACLTTTLPQDAEACFRILNDPAIKMGITVQQMVLDPRQGKLEVRLPA